MQKLQIASIEHNLNHSHPQQSLAIRYANNMEIPITSNSFSVPPNTNITFLLISNSEDQVQSPLLNTSLFYNNSKIWVALFSHSQSEYRCKILIQNNLFENFSEKKTIENHQKSTSSCKCSPEKIRGYFSPSGPCVDRTPYDENKQNRASIGEIAGQINEELKLSVIKLRKLLEIEKKSKETLLEQIKNLKTELAREKDENKKREKALLHDFGIAENTVSDMKFDILKTKTENKALQAENSRLHSELRQKQQSYTLQLEQFKDLKTEYESTYSSSSCLIQKIDDISGKSEIAYQEQLKAKDQNIKDLVNEISELKTMNKSLNQSQEMIQNYMIDDLLHQKVKELKIVGNFIRDPEQGYVFNNRKIILFVKGSQLMCKNGAVSKPFEEYMESIGAVVHDKKTVVHKRIRSHDFDKGLNTKFTRPGVNRSHVRSPISSKH